MAYIAIPGPNIQAMTGEPPAWGPATAAANPQSGILGGGALDDVNMPLLALGLGLMSGSQRSFEPTNPWGPALQGFMQAYPAYERQQQRQQTAAALQDAAQNLNLPGVDQGIAGIAQGLMGNQYTAPTGFDMLMQAYQHSRQPPDMLQVPQGNAVNFMQWNPETQSYEPSGISGFRGGTSGGAGGGWPGGVRPRLPTGYMFAPTPGGGLQAQRIPGLPAAPGSQAARPMTQAERQQYGLDDNDIGFIDPEGVPRIQPQRNPSAEDEYWRMLMEGNGETGTAPAPTPEPEEERQRGGILDLLGLTSAVEPEVNQDDALNAIRLAAYRDPENASLYATIAEERYGIPASAILLNV